MTARALTKVKLGKQRLPIWLRFPVHTLLKRAASGRERLDLLAWISFASRSAFRRAMFSRTATAFASYSANAAFPSRCCSSCLNSFSARARTRSTQLTKERTVSKWARALRYVARCKVPPTQLKTFMKEAGGVNACADRYAKIP